MNSPAKLTDTQFAILSEASQRKDRCLIPPKTLKAAAAQKVATKLLKAGLAREIKAKVGMEAWRRDDETGQAYALKLTDAGLKAIAADERGSQSIPSTAVPQNTNEDLSKAKTAANMAAAPSATAAPTATAPRQGTKIARVTELLQRDQGAKFYRGEIVHKGKAFPGEHAAIVDEDLWRRVQRRLEENRMERREGDKALEPSLLAGIVFDASSEPMTPTHAVKKGTRYRYYISHRLITGPASDSSRGQRVPASNLEALVIGRLRALLADPVEFLNAISNGERDAPMQKRLRDAAAALSARWEHLTTETQHDFARSILVRAQVHADRIDLDVGSARLVSWLLNQGADEGIVEGNRTSSANADGSEQTLIRLSICASLKRTGKEMKFVVEGVTNSAPADTTLIRLLVRGQKIAKRMFEPNCPPLEAIAHEERIAASYATRLVRLAFLAPDIVAAILAGKQPPGLTANKLMADTRLPLDWRDQRAALGFAYPR